MAAAVVLFVAACSGEQPDGQTSKSPVVKPHQPRCVVPLSIAGQPCTGNNHSAWLNIGAGKQAAPDNHGPTFFLTPEQVQETQAEKKQRAEMAEKAYYFGYATNEDALE